jgi:cytochrome c oxidase subunit 1
MIFFFTIPLLAGLGNYSVPIQIGARDMAFPRLNAVSFWLLIPAGLMMLASMFVQGGTAAGGWTQYPPLSAVQYSPGAGVDLWILGLHLAGLSSILGAINFVVTVTNLRAPGMTMWKIPMFCWAVFITQCIILVTGPGRALTMLLRPPLGTSFFVPAAGGDLFSGSTSSGLLASGRPSWCSGWGHFPDPAGFL